MTEQEPYDARFDAKDDVENDEITASAVETKVYLNNIQGQVFRAHRFGIYATFELNGKTEIGVLFPGKSFVNGSALLGDLVKTDQELSLLFPTGTKVWMELVSQVSRLVPESGSSLGVRSDGQAEKSEERKCGWVIMMLWFGGVEVKPNTEQLNNGSSFEEEDKSITACLEDIRDSVMEEVDSSLNMSASYSWFAVTIIMPKVNSTMPHPDLANHKSVEGTITAIHRPHGGVVECDGVKVFFHRSRVYIDEDHLSITATLEEVLTLGMSVLVDYDSNETAEGPIFEDSCSEFPNIALLVYVGSRPRISNLRHKPFPLADDEQSKYLVAKIIQFDPPGPTGVESGIAEILKPTDLNTLAFTKNSFKRYVDVESTIQYVKFDRNKLFHLGTLLHKSDLQYFFSSSCFGMSIFYCYASATSATSAKVQNQDVEISYEVSLGWKGSVSFLHATGQGGLTLTPNTKEDTLLYPRVFSFQSTKFLSREGMNIRTYEHLPDLMYLPLKDIVEGKLGSRSESLNGFTGYDDEGTVCARVHDIFPPQGNTGVSSGVVYIESGSCTDCKAVFDRKDCWLFGWSLEKADLQYILDLNEPCFVKLAKNHQTEEMDVKLRVVKLWIGWPPQHGVYEEPRDIPVEDRYRFLLYLECHSLTIADFMAVMKGDKAPRTFLPFRKDEMKGTVIQLDRGNKLRGVRDVGAVSGVIKVDKGPLIGALVTFHRRNTWVLGYNMGKADLTNLFIEGQKVSLEAISITADDRKKYPGLPYQYKHRATLVWTSKFRPRNDINKTVPESVHVNNWLKKRGLSWEKFQLLVKGKLPTVPYEIATRHRTNMLRGGELDALMSSFENITAGNSLEAGFPRIETLPVFRHGSEAARICDEALSVSGPTDPRIAKIVQSDQNAQMAYHIHKALGFALEEYKKMTGRGSTGNYSGFGDVFRADSVDNAGGTYWGFGAGNPVGGGGGGVGGSGGGAGSGVVVPGAGPVPVPENVYYHQHQQANQMANRLQQMAMEENGSRYRGGRGRYEDYEECDGDYGGSYGDRGGMKRQMNSQGGNRGKKNRGGWNR